MVSSQAKREAVAFTIARGHSERQACQLLGISRSMLAYRSVRAEHDAPVIAAMKRLALQYPALWIAAAQPSENRPREFLQTTARLLFAA